MLRAMAMKITRENHSVAAAILPNYFLMTPMQDVLGRWIVINEMGMIENGSPTQPMLTFTHTTYHEDEFFKYYNIVPSYVPENQFVLVEHTGEC